MKPIRNNIGLDAHTGSSFFVVLNRGGEVVKREKTRTTERELVSFIRSVPRPRALAFEESSIAQWLYVLLKDEVNELIVCDPAANVKKRGSKTDFGDALELADLLRVGRLRPVYHSFDERMQLRTLISGYTDLIQDVVRAKNRYQAVFRLNGRVLSGRGRYSDEKRQQDLATKTQRFVAQSLLEQIRMLEESRKIYLKVFQRNLRHFKEMGQLCSIPGIGVIHANLLVGIMQTPYRFADKYHLYAYAMLVKHKQISNDHVYAKLRAYGKTQLRGIFKSAAMVVVRSDNAFRRKYQRMLASGAGEKAARNAVARKIAATVLGVWKSGKKYNDQQAEVSKRSEQPTNG